MRIVLERTWLLTLMWICLATDKHKKSYNFRDI